MLKNMRGPDEIKGTRLEGKPLSNIGLDVTGLGDIKIDPVLGIPKIRPTAKVEVHNMFIEFVGSVGFIVLTP